MSKSGVLLGANREVFRLSRSRRDDEGDKFLLVREVSPERLGNLDTLEIYLLVVVSREGEE